MRYHKKELALLWNLIKDHKSIFLGEYEGLAEVRFGMGLAEFERRNKERHRQAISGIETIVTTNAGRAMMILRLAEIRCHHLSCAADTGYGDNSALCIHYSDPKDGRLYALALPGINYVPGEPTANIF